MTYYNRELYHHGVKGQKWGVRRYQNKDGTLTNAGQKRYTRDVQEKGWTMGEDGVARSGGKKNRKVQEPDANRWVKEDLSRTKRVVDSTNTMVNTLQTQNNNAMKKRSKNTVDLSNMTDAELRAKITRAQLEQQYNNIVNSQNESRGREHVQQILEGAGSALAITSSALGIALAIKELKG